MASGTRAPSTIVTVSLNGQTDFNVPFEYLARKFVVVTLLGIDRQVLTLNTDYRFVSKTAISLANPTPAGYTQLELRRVTSATERLVDFHDGSILRAYDLNLSQIQTLHVAEEARDLTAATIGVNDAGNLDARGRKLVNLAFGTDASDAVSVGQLTSYDTSAYNSAVAANAAMVKAEAASEFAQRDAASARASELAASASADTATTSAASARLSSTEAMASKVAAELAATRAEGAAAPAIELFTRLEAEELYTNTGLVNPRAAPYLLKDSDSPEVQTQKILQAMDAAAGRGILLTGAFVTKNLTFDEVRDVTIYSNCSISDSGSTQGYVLGFKNCTGTKTIGTMLVSGGSSALGLGVKVWSTTGKTCSLLNLSISVMNVECAWQFGDAAYPDQLVSEIVVSAGYTYNVRNGVRLFGTQTVIEFNGYQLIVVEGSVGTSLPSMVEVYGSVLHFNGGEMMLPSVTNGYGIVVAPLTSPTFENRYGIVSVTGTAVECASLLGILYNPTSVQGITVGSGRLSLASCTGYASFSGANIQTATDFSGTIIVDAACDFHRSAAKATPFVASLGPAVVHIADEAFDHGFPSGLRKVTGGICVHDQREIVRGVGLSTTVQSGSTLLSPTSAVVTDDTARYSGDFQGGLFTVPLGGLKGVTLGFHCNIGNANPADYLQIVINGATRYTYTVSWVVNLMLSLGDLPAGSTVGIYYFSGTGAVRLEDSNATLTVAGAVRI